MAEFKKLRGNRVFVEIPKKEETKLYVDHNTKEALEQEVLAKLGRVKVYAVGELVTDVTKGDYVLVDPEALLRSKKIPLSEVKTVYMITQFDIALVW